MHKNGITPELWDTLYIIQNDPLFKSFYLVGGTALSLQIGHRLSLDIDLFTNDDFDKPAIIQFMMDTFGQHTKIKNNQGSILQIVTENILNVDFVKYPYKLLDPIIETDGIRLIGKNDISAMKISAIGQRGYEAKDYIDIYYLLQEMPFAKMIENFKAKYETDDIQHYKRSLIFFDDVSPNSWKSVKMINEPLSISKLKETLIKEVTEYTRTQVNYG